VHDAESAIGAASRLVRQGVHAVLAKGGHVAGPAATDWLVDASGAHAISGARVDGDPRGTGCALASAIAVRLAEGDELVAACASAKAWLRDRIAAAIDVRGERHLP
jgi:hydroxymethylpyrimidine/phosphomethylpyrimidine kinase